MTTEGLPRLENKRRQLFVGRAVEAAEFASALDAAETPYQTLYVYGPGGLGKTTLLKEFALICRQKNAASAYIDARDIEPSLDGFLMGLAFALGEDNPKRAVTALTEQAVKTVVFIDTYELLEPIDHWVRERFLPQLPEHIIVIISGRTPPSVEWRADPGWRTLIRPLALRNLSPAECEEYFDLRAIPQTERLGVLQFTHGHPLALALVAEAFAQRPGLRFQPEETPDVIQALLNQFIQKTPGPAHRSALEACALVRTLTEGLLAEMLSMPDGRELFAWLRNLSFIESGPLGLYPHDLAREALSADLRWRNPEWYTELHNRARTYYRRMFNAGAGQEQRALFDYIYLHRDNPVIRASFDWQTTGGLSRDALRSGDTEALLAMVREHEGEESAQWAAQWFALQPQHVAVFRDVDGQPVGFFTLFSLNDPNEPIVEDDPAIASALRFMERRAPLRRDEAATHFRFWMARDSYQGVSPVQSIIFVNMVRHYLTHPRLAFTFIPCADPDFWFPSLNYGDLERVPEADYEIGDRKYGAYTHDWRVRPPMQWLALLAERETATDVQATQAPQAVRLVVLSREDFDTAVKDALRNITAAGELRENPLLRSRMVMEHAGADSATSERVTALQNALQQAADVLKASPKTEKQYRALYYTYLQPSATQEEAAEKLNLPFSTYRRHLRQGIANLTEQLWNREVGE